MNEDQAPISWSAADVFYHGEKSIFLVDDGEHFRSYKSRATVAHGIARRYIAQGIDEKESVQIAKNELRDREIDGHVSWCGNLAGHKKGIYDSIDGHRLLVLTSPKIPESKAGSCPAILPIIKQAFPDHLQRTIFLGWLKTGYAAVKAGIHQPAPMLALAGEANSGKSLLSYIVKLVLGGREANPHVCWSGRLPWNDNLVGAELLLMDDTQGSTDHKSRLELAANFKSSIYAAMVEMHRRNNSSIALRPVWRAMICCNDTAENLLILPPINSDTRDKISLLKVSKIELEIDTATSDGRRQLQDDITSDLPAFAAMLEAFTIPDNLRDSRSGIRAWQNPELLETIEATKPESKLAELLVASFESSSDLWSDLPRAMTASEVEARLTQFGRSTSDQAKKLLWWSGACGSYLSKLAKSGSEFVLIGEPDRHLKAPRYYLKIP